MSKQGMLPARVLPLLTTLRSLPLADRYRVLGTLLVGAPGTGKTIFESLLLLFDLLRGLPGVVLDPLGTLSEAFLFRLLWFLSEFPQGDDEVLWQRLRYIELGGDFITPFPLYYQQPGESLWDAGNRLITVLERASPQLVTGSALTWPAARTLARNAGMLLTALSLQLTKIEDLLFNTLEWQQSGRFDEAIRRNPQACEAVSYFRDYYLLLSRSEQRRIAGTFLDQVYPVIQSPLLREVFAGSGTPGIDLEADEAHPRLTIINGKGITDPASRSLAMQWILDYFLNHLKQRGRRNLPFVVTIDEFAHLAQAGTADNKPLADLFDEFLAQYARNNRIFVTAAFQSLDQVDERLQHTLLRLGTLITGRAGSFREARVIGDHLCPKDIYRVQHYKKVWGKVDPEPFQYRSMASVSDNRWQHNPNYPYFVLDYEPEYMSLENQTEDAAGMVQKLHALEFLCRPALSEGTASQEVIPLSLHDALRDPDTGEYIFPDPEQDAALIAQAQQQLAARSGIPRVEVLKEQEQKADGQARLTKGETGLSLPQGTPQNPRMPQPAAERDEQQPSSLPGHGGRSANGSREDAAHPAPRTAKETHSRPALDAQQRGFLTFITEHPETPVSAVYKGLGIGVTQGTRIRASLKAHGLVEEFEVRASSTTGGRPIKCLIPTIAALEFLGKDAPTGRGGILHRHVQQVVANGAAAKGYIARIEQHLPTGAIVDVHLEKGMRIAVEIAIASLPEREISHMKNCLAAGYDQVYTIFADEHLLGRTATAAQTAFTAEELGKIRLVPLRHLAQVL